MAPETTGPSITGRVHPPSRRRSVQILDKDPDNKGAKPKKPKAG